MGGNGTNANGARQKYGSTYIKIFICETNFFFLPSECTYCYGASSQSILILFPQVSLWLLHVDDVDQRLLVSLLRLRLLLLRLPLLGERVGVVHVLELQLGRTLVVAAEAKTPDQNSVVSTFSQENMRNFACKTLVRRSFSKSVPKSNQIPKILGC